MTRTIEADMRFYPTHSRRRAALAVLLTLPTIMIAQTVAADESPSGVQFENDILPILTAHCFKCHGLEARKAGLDLRTVGLMVRGGENGAAIVKGSAKESMLYERIADRSMPPEKELPLTDAKIDLIRRWLDAGAPSANPDAPLSAAEAPAVTAEDRQFWAFQKPARAAVPLVRQTARVRTPIDTFVLAKLEEKSLGFSSEADRHTIIRRACFDLLGLPPTPRQVSEFFADDAEGAYERMIDGLLASPHFGERWGRHWLDAAGYVDTIGDDTDATIAKVSSGKWLYRDYVVRSFNGDKPFDRFLLEQIAGDELIDWQAAEVLTPEAKELLVATGMLRTAADETLQNELNTADIRQAVLEHTMEVVASNLLGLTVNCARCHSHKFDPIPQEDYYRLLAIFSPAFNPQAWLQPAQRELPDISKAEKTRADAHNAEIDKQVSERNGRLAAVRKPYEERLFEARLATVPEPVRADTKAAIQTAADKRSEVQKYLAGKFEAALKVSPQEVAAALTPADQTSVESLTKEIAQLNSGRRSWGILQAVYDVGPPPPTYLLRRGNLDRPGAEVPAGFLHVLCESEARARVDVPKPNEHTSGRRLAFARWLTDRDSAAAGLVARVYVNRVWQYLFGQGIVSTSDNFGHSGARPTHGELLDWLALEFQTGGWRAKPLVKLMTTSAVYRQASQRDAAHEKTADSGGKYADPEAVDPGNELLWRMRLRQIESESVRDAILAASGKLDGGIGGPPTMIEGKPDGTVVVKQEGTPEEFKFRRSMYLLARRRYNLSLLEAFDQPELTSNCTRRTPSAVVSQSLTMLNDDFVFQQAGAFAKRVKQDATEERRQIEQAFRIALARVPDETEVHWAADLLRQQTERYAKTPMPPAEAAERALAHLCQMLLNTNEFLYIP
ncbi:MAG: PSD1 domain-containing protein [Planctomycetia bacterium]|nr:PSD1 domain-containing protein [Planctomycetia bacterium]